MPRQSPLTIDYTLDSAFSTETAQASQSRIFKLVTVVLPDPEPPLYLVDSNYDVKFDNIIYTRFPLTYNGVEVNVDGSIAKASITVANVNRQLMYYIEEYDGLRGCRVVIKTVYASALDEIYTPLPNGDVDAEPNPYANSLAYIEDESIIDVYGANETTIIFQLDPIIDLEIALPRRRFMVDSCYWSIYGDPLTCKVNKTLYPLPCGKTFKDCLARNNSINFGGFPGISNIRRISL